MNETRHGYLVGYLIGAGVSGPIANIEAKSAAYLEALAVGVYDGKQGNMPHRLTLATSDAADERDRGKIAAIAQEGVLEAIERLNESGT